MKVSVEEVEQAVKGFEAARAQVSTDIVDMVVNAEVLTAMNGVGNVIQAAMSAERFTGAYDLAGQPIMDADHTTALDAVRAAKELAEVTKPKGGAAINIGIQNNPGGNGNGNGSVKTFEQRVREKRGVLAESDVKFLGDGVGQEIIDGEVDDDIDDDDDEIIDDLADGTSDAEIEEADNNSD